MALSKKLYPTNSCFGLHLIFFCYHSKVIPYIFDVQDWVFTVYILRSGIQIQGFNCFPQKRLLMH